MNRVTGLLFLLGVMLVAGAGMMAIDTYMTEDRKTAVRAGINDQIDAGAERYEDRRENGCSRRCGFFGSMAHLVAGLRDGVFAQLPFDPETALPHGPDGWERGAYDLSLTETIVGHKLYRTQIVSATHNQLLMRFDKVGRAAQSGAVRIYRKGDTLLAVALEISREGLRKPGANKHLDTRFGRSKPTAILTDGMAFSVHPQTSTDPLHNTTTRVDYRHYSIDLDGQARIDVIARGTGDASAADIQAFLSGFDLAPIVENLPRRPAGYQPNTDPVLVTQADQAEG